MNNLIKTIGFWSGILAFSATVLYVVVQMLQVFHVLKYPLDEILIYATSLCIVLPLVIEFLALHYSTPDRYKFWSHAALFFVTLYAVYVTANYVVQLVTVIPHITQGKQEEVQVLRQLPHSMFWDFDALGYIFLGLATLAAVPAFKKHGFQRWVRRSLLANACITPLIAIVYFSPTYSIHLLMLGLPWAITAPLFMLLVAVSFRKSKKPDPQDQLTQGIAETKSQLIQTGI